jgi:hypothetical protein
MTEAPTEVRRAAEAKHTSATRQRQNPPPSTLEEAKADLRLTALRPPKHITTRLTHRMRQESISDWREGYQAGIEYALKLFEAIH